MKRSLVLLGSSLVVLALAVHQSLPKALNDHVAKLQAAQAFVATVRVTDLTGISEDLTVEFSKPNFLKIDGPTILVVSDGKVVTILDKRTNTYTQTPADAGTLMQQTTGVGVWAWSWFFEKDSAKLIKSASPGASRKMRGLEITEAAAILIDLRTTATLYVDNKSGFARGFTLKNSDKTIIVWAESAELRGQPLETGSFTFVAPAGAKPAAEAPKAGEVTWASVSAIFNTRCMPCHSAASSRGGLNLTSYDLVSQSRVITSGNAKNSILIGSVRSGRMPQGRAPLSDNELRTLEAWINGGLKP